jgi:AcrR family transcriptional regulator
MRARAARRAAAARRRAGSRERVMAAAGRLFSRKGFAGTSVDEIAAQARASPSSIYWHFRGGKDDILLAVVEEAAHALTARVLEAVGRADSLERKCEVFLDEVERQMRLSPDTLRVLLQIALERASEDPAVRRRIQAVFAGYRAAMLGELQKAFPEADREQLATVGLLLLGMLQGVFVQWQLDPDAVPLDRVLARARAGMVAQIAVLRSFARPGVPDRGV